MEGCPRLPGISFDPKVSIESVNICEKIPNYIATNYQENGDKYLSECEQMNRLRQNTITSSADENGIQLLKRYYCQLLLLRNRFPMLPETECAVRFTWEDAYQKEDNTYNDIRYEEACILYNLGAMYSRLGANESRKSNDSIKNACTYFRCGAACFEKVRDQYTTYSADFTPELLTCQVHILLAQAHETVLEKSLIDQRTASVNAHISMQVSEYYQMALLNLMKPGINSIISKKFREWRVCLTYKLSYYLALTYYFSGLVADETKKYGQAVCYYEAAVERLKEAWKNAEKISSDKTNLYKDAHTFTNDVFAGRYKAAKRDNDCVYFEKVPILSSLSAVQGVIVAKPQPFDCHDPDVSGTDIFQKLVPLDAHLAASEYSEEKAKLLRDVVELTENKNRELETFMNCLQLDRMPMNNEYLRLPRDLLDCCAGATARSNMTKDLVSAMQQLNSQHHDVTEQINDCEQMLTTLEETSNSIKSNKDFQDLKLNLKATRDMMLQANGSNIELHRHMTTIIEHLKILNGPLEQLQKTLPIIAELDDEANKPKLARLALLNEKVETMKKQREMLLNDLRKKIHDDDITKLVLMQRQENHKTLFSDQIKKHEELVNVIKQNCTAQDNILKALTQANADVGEIRTKVATTFDNRNRLIEEYIGSFKSFDDTLSKASEGIEFYKKQAAKLSKLIERINKLQSENQQAPLPSKPSINRQLPPKRPSYQNPLPTWSKEDLSNEEFSAAPLPTVSPDRPRLKDYLAAMKPDTWGSNPSRSSKRSSNRNEERMYVPPPTSNIDDNDEFHAYMGSSSTSIYSAMASKVESTQASLPRFNQNSYPVSSSNQFEQTTMSYTPTPAQSSNLIPRSPRYNPTGLMNPTSNQTQISNATQIYAQNQSLHCAQSNIPIQSPFGPQQSVPLQNPAYQPSVSQQQPIYQSTVPQQPVYQSSVPQQPVYQSPVPQQPTHQSSVPQQPVYQSSAPQQPTHQSSVPQQPTHQSSVPQQPVYQSSAPQQPTHQSSVPQKSVYQQPAYQLSVSQQPVYQSSILQQPVYQPTGPQQPAYQSSVPQQPVYQPTGPQQPAYQSSVPQQPVYQPAGPQQPAYQSSVPQQPIYQTPVPQQPTYQPPVPQQSVYQPSIPQQQIYPPHSFQQLSHQPPNIQQPSYSQPTNLYQITQPGLTGHPNVQQAINPQSQVNNDKTDSTQQALPQPKFDPYRPQPLGAYEIPKPQNPPIVASQQLPHLSQILSSQQQSVMPPTLPTSIIPTHSHSMVVSSQNPSIIPTQYQTTMGAARIMPQDIYRPGAFLSNNQSQAPPPSLNNNNVNGNLSVPNLIPSPAPVLSVSSTSSATSFASNNPSTNATVSIADDLLSLALEQQSELSTPAGSVESNISEVQVSLSVDEESPIKHISKPIACIQPLAMVAEEKSQTPTIDQTQSPIENITTSTAGSNSSQNSYDDKDKLEQLVSDLQRFEKYVSAMTKKILNGTVPLEVEWKELSDMQEKEVQAQTCAIGKCNPKLNRFQDIIPYDNSRVRLVQPNSSQQRNFNDYINATLIGRIRDASFIISQYPISTTVVDFWSMIYDQHVAIVVVLLRPEEIQSINVYPQKVGEELQFSSFAITLLSTKSTNPLTNHRILRIHNSQMNQSRTVVWLEHLNWPPKEMPDNRVDLLKFIQEVEHFLTQTRNPRSTILVTCFNGVSRTGPFISLFTCIQDINQNRSFPDVNKIVRLLRSKRRHIIQDMNQLKFIYETLLYYIQDILVKRGILTISSMTNHQPSSVNLKSTPSNYYTILLDNETQSIMDKAKPINPPTSNYDVGPILTATSPTTAITENKSTPKQLTAIEENFNLRPEESHIKPKITREDFFRTTSPTSKDANDPFNQLDPLWTFR